MLTEAVLRSGLREQPTGLIGLRLKWHSRALRRGIRLPRSFYHLRDVIAEVVDAFKALPQVSDGVQAQRRKFPFKQLTERR